jgi:methylthioribose-1-phosphate isomerase
MASEAALEVLGWRDDHIVALDQTALPHEIRMLNLTTAGELVDAIGRLAIRGAPVLGAAGALGVALAAQQAERDGWDSARLDAAVKQIAEARPTAVNLRREAEAVAAVLPAGPAAVAAAALAVVEATVTASHRMSERGARYLREAVGPAPLRVATHCNTGSLACLGWGSALGVVRALNNDHALTHVLVDETRPLLQGARLTCWELGELAIEHYLIPDAAGPFLISQGLVDAVVVGADRVAANGDVANKIGTYGLALAARQAHVPFVVVVPESTIDPDTPDGSRITVERRAEDEVTHVLGVPVAPDGTRALNYAFDITPAELVTAVVTEERVIEPGTAPRPARSPS